MTQKPLKQPHEVDETLLDFLKDRLKEREEENTNVAIGYHEDAVHLSRCEQNSYSAGECDCEEPSFALDDIQSKRVIIGLHVPDKKYCTGDRDVPEAWHVTCKSCGGSPYDYPEDWPCDTIRALAAPYTWHSDYREEWRL